MTATVRTPWALRPVTADVRDEACLFWDSFEGQPEFADVSESGRRLLAVSGVLFRRHGAVATSVRDITRAAGMTPGALYNHFESKELLLYAIVQHGHARVHRLLDQHVRPGDRPARQLCDFVRAYVVGHLEHQRLAQVVRREYLHLTGERLTSIVALRRSLRDRLAATLRAGAADGSFTLLGPGPSSGATATAIMVLDLCVSTTEWYGPRHSGDAAELAELYVAAALRLLGA